MPLAGLADRFSSIPILRIDTQRFTGSRLADMPHQRGSGVASDLPYRRKGTFMCS